jgi:hypothetical protein
MTKQCKCCKTDFEPKKTRGESSRVICYDCEDHFQLILKGSIRDKIGTNVSHARTRANRDNVPFDIDVEYMYGLIPRDGLCPILKQPMVSNTRYTMSIDKIIPEKGYTKGNVQIISMRANQMKNDATASELKLFANYIQRNY